MEEPYTKRLLDKLISIQNKYYQDFRLISNEENAEGRVGILQIVGPDGGAYTLQMSNGLVRYADHSSKPLHVIEMTEDTFLNLLTGEIDLSTAFDKGRCRLIEYNSGNLDLVEMTKWKAWFNKMGGIVSKMLMWENKR